MKCFEDAWDKYGDSITAVEIWANRYCVVHQDDVKRGSGDGRGFCAKKMQVTTASGNEDTKPGEAYTQSSESLRKVKLSGRSWYDFKALAESMGARLPYVRELEAAGVSAEHDSWVPVLKEEGGTEKETG